jgi:uncharacterized membrane protein YgdD (TMEM256/DUF423 family)
MSAGPTIRKEATLLSSRGFFSAGCASGAISVILGAFAAHSLRGRIDPQSLAAFETGVRYQMFHALALLGVGLASARWGAQSALGAREIAIAGWLFLAGTVLFSGSLYLLAATGARWLGAVTPAGGLAFIAGWVVLWMGVRRE